MSLRYMPILVAVSLMAVIMSLVATPAFATGTRIIRLGYLDHPGSDLFRIAAAKGHFREEGLQIELVRFTESAKGLAALEAGGIDVGAFSVSDSLRAIAGGKGFRIVAGGGTLVNGNPLVELDDVLQVESEGQGIVVLIAPS